MDHYRVYGPALVALHILVAVVVGCGRSVSTATDSSSPDAITRPPTPGSSEAVAPTPAATTLGADVAPPSPSDPNTAPAPTTDAVEPPMPDVSAGPTDPARPQGTAVELPADGSSLLDRLQTHVGAGRPVAILASSEGLAAVSADTARWALLVPGAIPWVIVDLRARVIWFGRLLEGSSGNEELYEVLALDLLATTTRPTPISARLPVETVFVIAHPPRSPDSNFQWIYPTIAVAGIATLYVDPRKPSLEPDGGRWADEGLFDMKAHRLAVKKGALGKDAIAFVKAIAERSGKLVNPLPSPPRPAGEVLPARILVPMENCDEACGTLWPWPGQPWAAVVVTSVSDVNALDYALWHLQEKRFMNPGIGPSTELPDSRNFVERNALIAPDGSAFIQNGALYRPGSKPWGSPSSYGGGWLGGHHKLPSELYPGTY